MNTYLKKDDIAFVQLDETLKQSLAVSLNVDCYSISNIKNNEGAFNAYQGYLAQAQYVPATEAEFNAKLAEVKALIND